LSCETIDEGHHLVALRHGEAPARAKVILDVDYEQNIVGADH
jgi:hypothetical protein